MALFSKVTAVMSFLLSWVRARCVAYLSYVSADNVVLLG